MAMKCSANDQLLLNTNFHITIWGHTIPALRRAADAPVGPPLIAGVDR